MNTFLIPDDESKFKEWGKLPDDLKESFRGLTYNEKLDFWNKYILHPEFRFSLRRPDPYHGFIGYYIQDVSEYWKQFDEDQVSIYRTFWDNKYRRPVFRIPLILPNPFHDYIGNITPENPEDREKFYEFFKPYFEYKYSDLCNLKNKIDDLDERLSNAPDRTKLLEREYGRLEEKRRIGRGAGQTYYEIGYNDTLEGRSFEFRKLDRYEHYWRLLEGETTCRYLAHLNRLIEGITMPVVQTKKKKEKYTIAQRYYCLQLLGLERTDFYKKYDVKTQEKLLEIILNTDDRTIRGMRNREPKYSLKPNKDFDQFCANLPK
jgi:hypothetical protein